MGHGGVGRRVEDAAEQFKTLGPRSCLSFPRHREVDIDPSEGFGERKNEAKGWGDQAGGKSCGVGEVMEEIKGD